MNAFQLLEQADNLFRQIFYKLKSAHAINLGQVRPYAPPKRFKHHQQQPKPSTAFTCSSVIPVSIRRKSIIGT
jgi:predicted transcriptional regulator